jgi:hypothetical protein
MCQQWLSIIGYVLDITGFLMVAREWYHVFNLDSLQRRNRIQADYDRTRAEEQGEQWQDPSGLEHTMWREFQRLLNREIKFRKKLFFGGAALIVLGFFCQVLGSWPGGVPLLGFRQCS